MSVQQMILCEPAAHPPCAWVEGVAVGAFETALRFKPDYAEARTNLEATRAAIDTAAKPNP